LAMACRGSDMAAIGDTGATAYLISATEGVTVADTSEQDTQERCMEPAWAAAETT
jgi:hypothetical protein